MKTVLLVLVAAAVAVVATLAMRSRSFQRYRDLSRM
jgi:hypothetical protein